jgi:hypothetical protein
MKILHKLAGFLIQFPSSFHCTENNIKWLEETLSDDFLVAVEFRHIPGGMMKFSIYSININGFSLALVFRQNSGRCNSYEFKNRLLSIARKTNSLQIALFRSVSK